MKIIVFLLHLLVSNVALSFEIIDDENNTVMFDGPVERVISLSPHATELLYKAGATNQILATVSYSDFPEAAKALPRIGSYKKLDLESVIKLKPDLIVAWKSSGSLDQVNELERLGYKIYFSEPKDFKGIAENIIKFGRILGTGNIAAERANSFLNELNTLKLTYKNLKPVSVFYQVWNNPLMTINKDHLITNVIDLCGGRNVFGELFARAPRVSIESVILKNPQVIIIGMSDNRKGWVKEWYKWDVLQAVKEKHVYTVNADYIVRQGPRVLKGAKKVCEILENVRNADEIN